MTDTVRVRMYVRTGFAGANHEDYLDVPRSEWAAMSEREQDEYLNTCAGDYLASCVDYGAYVEEN